MELRQYQKHALDLLYDWLENHPGKNPCMVLPTGSGKSHVIAAFCKQAVQEYPEDSQILVLTHVKELIEQNYEKMRQHWPAAPAGIYSAGLGQRNFAHITFGSIQSLYNKAEQIGYVSVIKIDECHLVSHEQTGIYRKLIDDLRKINPKLRVIGYTATPWRLNHGFITDGDTIFDGPLIEPITIQALINLKFLTPLKSKLTEIALDTSAVKKRGGEFIESQLQAAVDNEGLTAQIVQECRIRGHDRKAWLFFCTGVNHALHMRDELSANGITAACVTGDTPAGERRQILDDFKAGKIRAVTNANVLTTGFDYPGIDFIAMCRPTMSPGLYMQMAGRGMRIAENKPDCIVLDFAGNVQRHGPIVNVRPPEKKAKTDGEAPTKPCPECSELVAISTRTCPSCGFGFPPPESASRRFELHDDDIMGKPVRFSMPVREWVWRRHVARTSGNIMLMVTYYGEDFAKTVDEYFPIFNPGEWGKHKLRKFLSVANAAGASVADILQGDMAAHNVVDALTLALNKTDAPAVIKYEKEKQFFNVVDRVWIEEDETSGTEIYKTMA